MNTEVALPPQLEDNIVRALRREHLLRRSRKVPIAIAAVVAAVIAVFTIPRHAPPAASQYMLLLYDTPTLAPGDHAPEYGKWARANGAHVVAGDELGVQLATLGSMREGEKLGGYFIISAASDAEAMRIARDCPHVRNGGALAIRKIIAH